MRRSASEIIRNLERRIARLERKAGKSFGSGDTFSINSLSRKAKSHIEEMIESMCAKSAEYKDTRIPGIDHIGDAELYCSHKYEKYPECKITMEVDVNFFSEGVMGLDLDTKLHEFVLHLNIKDAIFDEDHKIKNLEGLILGTTENENLEWVR
jgi:hypothetical protein